MSEFPVERIQEIIDKADEDLKSIEVDKPLEFDCGNLVAEDKSLIETRIVNLK